jgi:hypothetical protein
MPYSDFSLRRAKDELGLVLLEEAGFFAELAPVPISEHLRQSLAENVPLAVSVNTERRARSSSSPTCCRRWWNCGHEDFRVMVMGCEHGMGGRVIGPRPLSVD